MTLLDFEEKKPLAQRFSFLNIAAGGPEDSPQVTARPSGRDDFSLRDKTCYDNGFPGISNVPDQVDPADMIAVCVAKISTDSGKLFINIAALNPDVMRTINVNAGIVAVFAYGAGGIADNTAPDEATMDIGHA